MAVKLQHNSLLSSSSSSQWLSQNSIGTHVSSKRLSDWSSLLSYWGNSKGRCFVRLSFLKSGHHLLNGSTFRKSRRMGLGIPLASDDGVTFNGSPQVDVEEMRVKLNNSLQGKEFSDGLVQSLHDAARVFEMRIKEQSSLSKLAWFSTAWLGVDRSAWVKALSYQASVYSLLQAAIEISSRGEGRDRDINVFVQRSLLRQSAPLESLMRDKLSLNQTEVYDWVWSEQVPAVVASFVQYFEGDPYFTAVTAGNGKCISVDLGNASDISLLILALTCIAAVTKLGPAKVSCSQFFSMIPETSGKLMDMLVDFIPISQAYHSIKEIGLRREFLVHFGPRVATCRVKNDRSSEEIVFWVDLLQRQLQRAIDRERIWSRLTTSESIEVLEKDLAIFGFFIALGRSTQSFSTANGFDVIDNPIESFVRYLIGGSVLYYPQLSSISSYQLYVEVVCEELDWLPFYPVNIDTPKQSHGHRSKPEVYRNAEAIPQIVDVCFHWMQSFIKYSKWLQNPSNVKAARFLSRGHNELIKCMEGLGISKNELIESNSRNYVGRTGCGTYSLTEKDLDSLDKALESVEEAVIRLEKLLEELHVSSSKSGKEQLKAACSDLEKIRKLKKEAEFLEASFRAKAASIQGDDDSHSQSSVYKQQQCVGENLNSDKIMLDKSRSKPRGLWSFFMRPLTRQPETELSTVGRFVETTPPICVADLESNEIHRFELLRNELMELEKRVQRSSNRSENEENIKVIDDNANYAGGAGGAQLAQIQKTENIIVKSLDKLKETSTDVWQGTKLLAIDAAAAMGLLRRVMVGDELTDKEKKALRRTLTDLASVVPIGFLMLLPVTAVGHAAMLAAIQRYVPALIPSTYGPERLDLLRKLEKVKEMKTCEVNPEENVEDYAELQ
ncbi:LETM1 domain-containing protein [Cephalotus follicularis]|uniref:LETM1 domain-containing protein n=1 Tax=Cephalotus follicularis TaxID=3775 RepID=A0A1Q3CVH8_CEPFO|nr:LETM1 domain-containing protein [Cephalotus follicularis]